MAQFVRIESVQPRVEGKRRNKTVNYATSLDKEPEMILDVQGRGRGTKYLVKWTGFDDSHNSWEHANKLANSKHLIKEFTKNKKQGNSRAPPQPKSRAQKLDLQPPMEPEISMDSRRIRTDEKASRKLFKEALSPPTEDNCEPHTMPPRKTTTTAQDNKAKGTKSVQPSKKNSPVNRRGKRRGALPKLEDCAEDIYNVQHFEQLEQPSRRRVGEFSQPISSQEATNIERASRHLPTKPSSVMQVTVQELRPETTTAPPFTPGKQSDFKQTPSQYLKDLIKEPPSSDKDCSFRQIQSATEVTGHLRRDKSLHLRLRWDNNQLDSDFCEVYYPLEVVERLRPQLVLDYLKKHIKFVRA